MKKLPKIAVATLCASFTLLGTGCFLSINSCAKNDKDEPSIVNPDKPNDEENNGDDENNGNNNNGDNTNQITPAETLYEVLMPEGIPQQVKEYTGFTVNFNKDNHTPNYVAWELLASETTGTANRNDYDFWQDKEIEGCSVKDYQYSIYSYQRGHMCPAADQKWSEVAMRDCMVMANMCPQYASLNEKAWATLENKEREWARRDGAVWIICGPIYTEDDTQRIGPSEVRVPSSYFKAFLAKDIDEPRAIAFVFPNGACPGNMQDYSMSIDDLEEILGYDFFSALPDDIENKVEAEYSFTEWY